MEEIHTRYSWGLYVCTAFTDFSMRLSLCTQARNLHKCRNGDRWQHAQQEFVIVLHGACAAINDATLGTANLLKRQ